MRAPKSTLATMRPDHELIERGIPDLIDPEGLPPGVAAEIDFLADRCARWIDRGAPMVQARARVAVGDDDGARALLALADLSALDPQERTAAAWAVSRIGSPAMAEALLDALGDEPDLVVAGVVPLGPRALAEGPLIAATGDLTGAIERLTQAVVVGDARAPVWGALARVELARVRLCASAVGGLASTAPGPDADQLLNAATLFFRAGGYHGLSARIGRLTQPDGHAPPLGGPTVGRLRPGRPWRIGFGVMGDTARRESKGLVMIRHLVQHPGRPMPAIALDRLARGVDAAAIIDAAARLRADADGASAEIRALLFDDGVRSRVGKLLSRTVEGLTDDQPLLAAHLRATLHTGHVCRYDPPPGLPVVWSV